MVPNWILSPLDLAFYAIAINFAAFAAFGIDKMRAEAGRRRVSERRLLLLALVGGTPGAYAGRQLFRHKTRKQPFSAHLHKVGMVQLFGLAALAGWIIAG